MSVEDFSEGGINDWSVGASGDRRISSAGEVVGEADVGSAVVDGSDRELEIMVPRALNAVVINDGMR